MVSEPGTRDIAASMGLSLQYGLFAGGSFSWFSAVGIHQAMLLWLLVGELGVGASWVGAVQMLGTLPILILLLPSGLVADRVEKRSQLVVVQLLGSALCCALALLVGLDGLSLITVCIYLVFWGIAHSIFFNTSRTMFRQAAPESHRARVLSIHPLAFPGVTPFSIFGSGLLADGIGPLESFGLASVAVGASHCWPGYAAPFVKCYGLIAVCSISALEPQSVRIEVRCCEIRGKSR